MKKITKKVVLAIETSTNTPSVSVLEEGIEKGQKSFSGNENVSELLLTKISELSQENGFRLSDIGLIAVSIGPGSLTGIRLGIAVGKGLAKSLEIRCVGVSLFDSLALSQKESKNLLCILLAGRDDYFWQLFVDGVGSEIRIGRTEDLKMTISSLRGVAVLFPHQASDKINDLSNNIIKVYNLAQLIGLKGMELSQFGEDSVTPLYIRNMMFKKVIEEDKE